MAEMKVGMTLTLADTASAPLRAFTALVEQLQAAVNRIAPKLEAIATAITSVGTASESRGSTGVSELTMRLEQLSAGLTATIDRLAVATAGFVEMGTAAATAGSEMRTQLAGANTEAGSLAKTVKGLVELYAAMKIEKGIKGSVDEAIDFQRTENRLKNMKLAPEDEAQIRSSISATAQSFPQFDNNKLLELAIDLRNATGSAHEASIGLKGFAETIFALNLSLPTGQKLTQQGELNLAKIFEARGAVMDEGKRNELGDLIAKITAATQGRVNPDNLFANLTMAKGGVGREMDTDMLKTLAVLIEEDSISGKGGSGRQGNMVSQFVAAIQKGRAVTRKNRQEWMDLGLLDSSKVAVNREGDIKDVQPGAIKGGDLAVKNAKRWVLEYMIPAMAASGVDVSDMAKLSPAIARLLPNQNAQEFAFQIASRQQLTQKGIDNIDQAAGKDEQVANGMKLAAAATERFETALHNLGIAIGESVLPLLTPLIDGLASFLRSAAEFTKDHPMITAFLTVGAAIGGLALGIAGFAALLGTVGLGPIFAAIGTVAVAAFGAIIAALAPIAVPLLAITALAAGFYAAWEFTKLMADFEIFGSSLGTWAKKAADFLLAPFRWAFELIRLGIEAIIPSAKAAQATGDGGQHGASGDWERPDENYGHEGRGSVAPVRKTKTRTAYGGGSTGGRAPSDAAHRRELAGLQADAEDELTGGDMGRFISSKVPGIEAATELRLDKELAAFREQEAKASGERHQAELIRIQNRIQASSQELVSTGRLTQAEVDQAIARAKAASNYSYQQEAVSKLQADEREKEEAINAQVQNGEILESAATQRKYALRQELAQQLDDLLAKLKALADQSGDPKLQRQASAASAANARDLTAIDPQTADFNRSMLNAGASGFSELVSSVAKGTTTMNKAFETFGQRLKNTFIDLISKRLGDQLMASLFGGATSGGGGGILGLIGGLFGSGGGSTSTGMAGSDGVGVAGLANGFGGSFAIGTNYVPHDMLALIHEGESVVPKKYNPAAGASPGMGGSPSGIHIHASPEIMNARFGDLLDAHLMTAMANR